MLSFMCFIFVCNCYGHRTMSTWLARDWGMMLDCMCVVNLACKSQGAQLWIVCAWSGCLARDQGHVMDRNMCGYVHVRYGMDSVCSLSDSLTRCCFPFQVVVQELIKGKALACLRTASATNILIQLIFG